VLLVCVAQPSAVTSAEAGWDSGNAKTRIARTSASALALFRKPVKFGLSFSGSVSDIAVRLFAQSIKTEATRLTLDDQSFKSQVIIHNESQAVIICADCHDGGLLSDDWRHNAITKGICHPFAIC